MTNREEIIKRLSDQEWEVKDIAREVNLSTRQVGRIRSRLGINKGHPRLSDETRERIRHLSEDEGWPPEEIAATLGLTYDAVCRWCIRGPGKEWRETAAVLAIKHRKLWTELRRTA